MPDVLLVMCLSAIRLSESKHGMVWVLGAWAQDLGLEVQYERVPLKS